MTRDTGAILVVEDDEDDFFLTGRVLRKITSSRIIRVSSGREAIEYLAGGGPYGDRAAHPLPAIMFLDLKMDQGTGLEVLDWVKTHRPADHPQIFVLSGSNEPKDRELVRLSGVTSGYIVKPLTADHVKEILAAAPRR